MNRLIVGTAGHVDHGKTRLIHALTGIDCDRLAEEKDRGITIDLGFAFLREAENQIGIVDVPGHQKFLHNALAGLGAVKALILVVAVDEGVAEQTREHLALASLLGIPHLVVALTKADLVDSEIAELAAMEVTELLEASSFTDIPVVTTSAEEGRGLDELRSILLDWANEHGSSLPLDAPVRLPIDRAFHLKGLGVVVTGTLLQGELQEGDELALAPGGQKIRVRGIQVHGEDRPQARAGERTSLRIAGAELEDLPRGRHLITPGSQNLSTRFVAQARLLPEASEPLRGWREARIHLLAEEVMGKIRSLQPEKIEPGSEGCVEVVLERPIPVVRGDRFVVRRPSPPLSLGGGQVLDPNWRSRSAKIRREAIPQLTELSEAVRWWAFDGGVGGLDVSSLERRLGWSSDRTESLLRSLVEDQLLIRCPADKGGGLRLLHPLVVKRTSDQAKAYLKKWFKRNRLQESMPKAEFLAEVIGTRGLPLAATFLKWWVAEKILRIEGDQVAPPGRKAQLKPEESQLAQKISELMDEQGLTPPSPPEMARRLGANPAIFDGVLEYCRKQGKIYRLPGGLVVSARAVDALVEQLRDLGWERFGVPQFKDHFGLSRKWAIPVLEYLDSRGVTRRVGNDRQLVQPVGAGKAD